MTATTWTLAGFAAWATLLVLLLIVLRGGTRGRTADDAAAQAALQRRAAAVEAAADQEFRELVKAGIVQEMQASRRLMDLASAGYCHPRCSCLTDGDVLVRDPLCRVSDMHDQAEEVRP